jgi:hypothetical protein
LVVFISISVLGSSQNRKCNQRQEQEEIELAATPEHPEVKHTPDSTSLCRFNKAVFALSKKHNGGANLLTAC